MSFKIRLKSVLVVAGFAGGALPASAYDVWMGMPYTPKDSAAKIAQWDLTAEGVTGLNVNLSDVQRPSQDRNSTATWSASIAEYTTGRSNAMKPIPRTTFSYTDDDVVYDRGTIAERLTDIFQAESTYGHTLTSLMLYANKLLEDPDNATITFTAAEMAEIRAWLDDPTNGSHADVKLYWNVRNNGLVERIKAEDPNIDGIVMEAAPDLWFANAGNRQTFLKWAVTNSVTQLKPLVFQIPLTSIVDDSLSPYEETRKLIRWFSSPAMLGSTDFIRRDDVHIMPIAYKPTLLFYPEMNAPENEYVDSMTGLALSLIEQKELFEGRGAGGLITEAQAVSFARSVTNDYSPIISTITDQTTPERTAIAVDFVVDDLDGLAGLTVTGNSSNPTLVPNASIIPSGTGTNRLATITPVYGQTGTTTISLMVSDGTYAATNSFLLTVTPDPDSDGDGMGDATEIVKGRNPNSAADLGFEFYTDGVFDGWGNFNNITSPTVSGGVLSGTGTGDAQFKQDNFLFPANDAPYMIVKFKTATASTLQFFWGHTSAGGFSGTRRIDMPYSASLDWQAIIIPASTHADWLGKIITALRIDPSAASGVFFEIDWIRASDGDLDNDGILDEDEGTGDSDGDGLFDIEDPNGAYEQWALRYNVSGGKNSDDDHDGLLNIYEYGLGGNPTNGVIDGHLPTFGRGVDWFEYVHAEHRATTSAVSYTVEISTNLVSGIWVTNGVEHVGFGAMDATFNTVTNRISTEVEEKQFIRLRIK